jgi:hypothetical protein
VPGCDVVAKVRFQFVTTLTTMTWLDRGKVYELTTCPWILTTAAASVEIRRMVEESEIRRQVATPTLSPPGRGFLIVTTLTTCILPRDSHF